MKLKINHYASKEIHQSATFGFEAVFIDFFLAFISGVFAYMGYKGNIALLFFGCLFVSVGCFIVGAYSVALHFFTENDKDSD